MPDERKTICYYDKTDKRNKFIDIVDNGYYLEKLKDNPNIEILHIYRTKFDLVLKEHPGTEGLSRSEAIDLINMLNDTEFYPIEIPGYVQESSAMGFITASGAEKINYDYDGSGLKFYIENIIDDMTNESESSEYEFKGLSIYLSR